MHKGLSIVTSLLSLFSSLPDGLSAQLRVPRSLDFARWLCQRPFCTWWVESNTLQSVSGDTVTLSVAQSPCFPGAMWALVLSAHVPGSPSDPWVQCLLHPPAIHTQATLHKFVPNWLEDLQQAPFSEVQFLHLAQDVEFGPEQYVFKPQILRGPFLTFGGLMDHQYCHTLNTVLLFDSLC